MLLSEQREIDMIDVLLSDQHVGRISASPDGVAAFEYSPKWLENGFSISPFSLPLRKGVFIAQAHPLNGIFGVFNDSLPDSWGRLLVDRMLLEKGINPQTVGFLTRLAIVGSSGSGALEYQPAIEGLSHQTVNDLDRIARDCARILESQSADDLDALFTMGGSSGGARPKVFYEIDGQDWIVKFPSSLDPKDIGIAEYKLALAAEKSGIVMPEVKLLPSSACSGYFATKRFDREKKQSGVLKKTHMVSVSGLLETSHRTPNLDYDLLLRLTLRLTDSPKEVERMYRLMVFNVLCGNRDDHSKNFTFVYSEHDGWRLSPGYDLTSNAGMFGERATTVNGKGKDITKSDLLEVATRAGIPQAQAISIIEQTRAALLEIDALQE